MLKGYNNNPKDVRGSVSLSKQMKVSLHLDCSAHKMTEYQLMLIFGLIFQIKLDKLIECLQHFDTSDLLRATQNPALKLIDLHFVLDECRRALSREANSGALLECVVPLVICGDTHGQLSDVWRIFAKCGYPPTTRYLFLGEELYYGE